MLTFMNNTHRDIICCEEEASNRSLICTMRKIYKDENDNLFMFDNKSFKILFDETWKLSNKKLIEYCSEFAVNIGLVSESVERVKSWRKCYAAPEDLDLVANIAKVLGCAQNKLLISFKSDSHEKCNDEDCDCMSIDRSQREIRRAKDILPKYSLYRFSGVSDCYALKLDGFSNIFDLIVGIGYDKEKKKAIYSDYAERIGKIISWVDYPSISELLGYQCKYTNEEIKSFLKEGYDKGDNAYFIERFMEDMIDSEGKYAFSFDEFCTKLINTSITLEDDDCDELVNIIHELQDNIGKADCGWACLTIEIAFDNRVIETSTYGPGWVHPTHTNRWDLIKDLLIFFDSRIDRLCFCNATEMEINQFEYAARFRFDLTKC